MMHRDAAQQCSMQTGMNIALGYPSLSNSLIFVRAPYMIIATVTIITICPTGEVEWKVAAGRPEKMHPHK